MNLGYMPLSASAYYTFVIEQEENSYLMHLLNKMGR